MALPDGRCVIFWPSISYSSFEPSTFQHPLEIRDMLLSISSQRSTLSACISLSALLCTFLSGGISTLQQIIKVIFQLEGKTQTRPSFVLMTISGWVLPTQANVFLANHEVSFIYSIDFIYI